MVLFYADDSGDERLTTFSAATEWVAGRGRPARDPRSVLNRSKPARWHVYVSALDVLATMPEVRILAVARPGTDRAAAYRILMRRIEHFLAIRRNNGLVVLDGDSAELRTLHGELDPASRRIVEDPWKRDARESRWLQAADFVAYAAYQHIARRPDRAFMWEWYERCLSGHLVHENAEGPPRGGPSTKPS